MRKFATEIPMFQHTRVAGAVRRPAVNRHVYGNGHLIAAASAIVRDDPCLPQGNDFNCEVPNSYVSRAETIPAEFLNGDFLPLDLQEQFKYVDDQRTIPDDLFFPDSNLSNLGGFASSGLLRDESPPVAPLSSSSEFPLWEDQEMYDDLESGESMVDVNLRPPTPVPSFGDEDDLKKVSTDLCIQLNEFQPQPQLSVVADPAIDAHTPADVDRVITDLLNIFESRNAQTHEPQLQAENGGFEIQECSEEQFFASGFNDTMQRITVDDALERAVIESGIGNSDQAATQIVIDATNISSFDFAAVGGCVDDSPSCSVGPGSASSVDYPSSVSSAGSPAEQEELGQPQKRYRSVVPKRSSRPKSDVGERKERKKIQNKEAAHRYRLKKKEEKEKNALILQELLARNKSLKKILKETILQFKGAQLVSQSL